MPALKKTACVLEELSTGGDEVTGNEIHRAGLTVQSDGIVAAPAPALDIPPLVFLPEPRVIEVVRSPNPHVVLSRDQAQDSFDQGGLITDADGNSLTVCNDGTSQEIRPTLLDPKVFEARLRELFPDTEKTLFRADGTYDLFRNGQRFRLFPTFDSRVEIFSEQTVAPALYPLDEGTLAYAVRKGRQVIITTVRME